MSKNDEEAARLLGQAKGVPTTPQATDYYDAMGVTVNRTIHADERIAKGELAQDQSHPNTDIDDLLDHLVFKEGTGPNGSGGEIRYWKGGKDVPAKQAITALVLDLIAAVKPEKWEITPDTAVGPFTETKVYWRNRTIDEFEQAIKTALGK